MGTHQAATIGISAAGTVGELFQRSVESMRLVNAKAATIELGMTADADSTGNPVAFRAQRPARRVDRSGIFQTDDHADWLFEAKCDGFRAAAEIVRRRLISRNGNRMPRF
jgi:ATP-dependent DNA ligase